MYGVYICLLLPAGTRHFPPPNYAAPVAQGMRLDSYYSYYKGHYSPQDAGGATADTATEPGGGC